MSKQSGSNPENPKYRRLTHKSAFALGKFLEQVCSTDEQGYAIYQAGWSDQRVLVELSPTLTDLSHLSLSEFRRKVFGNTRKPKPPKVVGADVVASDDPRWDNVRRHEEKISRLERAVISQLEKDNDVFARSTTVLENRITELEHKLRVRIERLEAAWSKLDPEFGLIKDDGNLPFETKLMNGTGLTVPR